MPLKCLRGEEEIYAFNTKSDEAWESLRKGNAAEKDLRMPCCGAQEIGDRPRFLLP